MRKALAILGFAGLTAVGAAGVWMYKASAAETPKYDLVEQDGAIEIRDYPALRFAEITTVGTRREGVNGGFRPLANYIFAKERAGDSIAMTAPVTQQREKIAMTAPVTQTPTQKAADDEARGAEGPQTWTVRFIMPPQYTMETLPKPANADVRLLEVSATRRAAIRFSGVADDASIARNEAQLRDWLKGRNIAISGAPTYAYYNAPWIPGPFRRNEVLFDVDAN